MLGTSEERLEKAIFLENRGYIKEAKVHYEFLKQNIPVLDVNALMRICEFYKTQDEDAIVFQAAKIGIKKAGKLKTFIPYFLYSWKNKQEGTEELEWALKQPGMEILLEEQLLLIRMLFDNEKVQEAYMYSIELIDKVEREFYNNPSTNGLYIDALLNLIEMEYQFENFTQARFHLRKLIFLKAEKLMRVDDIINWAVILDEISEFAIREDAEHLIDKVSNDLKIIINFYRNLKKSTLPKSFIKIMKNSVFKEPLLENKRKVFVFLINKISGKSDWYLGIEEVRKSLPHDLLMTLLYSEFLRTNHPELLSEFWQTEFPKHADKKEAIRAFWNFSKKENVKLEQEKDVDFSVTFFGGGEEIGGTSILISVKNHHILLDAGMHLNKDIYHPDYSPLFSKGLSFEDIDALLITHAHLDHTGAVPFIHKQRSELPTYTTDATKQLMKLLLLDSARIASEKNMNFYNEEDVLTSLLSITDVEFYETFTIPSKEAEWKVTYYPSGHIIGAGSIHLEIEEVSILFTGDYSVEDQNTVEGLVLPPDLKVDVVITESTYGFLPTTASVKREIQEKLFIESIKRTTENNGTMLIPAFAVGRAQEILLVIKEAFKEGRYLPFDLYVDGRVTEVCKVYQRYSEQGRFINPKFYQNEESDSIFFGGGIQPAQEIYSNRQGSKYFFNDFMEEYILAGNNCIIASSGMLSENSASSRYAERLIADSRNTISFTGYMDYLSQGYKVLQKSKSTNENIVEINNIEKELKAKIESFRLSAHASREQIVHLVTRLQPKQVFLMHGEHTKRYQSNQTIVSGEKIYPSLIELLSSIDEIEVIPAFNSETYFLNKEG